MGLGAGVLAAMALTAWWAGLYATSGAAAGWPDLPWPIVAAVAAWLVAATAFLAVARAAGRADRTPVERPSPPSAVSLPAPPSDPPAPRRRGGRFAREPRADPLRDLGPPDVGRVTDLTRQVLAADACAIRPPGTAGNGDGSVVDGRRWRAVAATPLLVRGAVTGDLAVASDEPGRAFDDGDLDLLATMAGIVSAALHANPAARWPDATTRAQVDALIGAATRDERDRRRHQLTVTLARHVGARLVGTDTRARAELVLAAELHDVGMVRVPRAVLRHSGPLAVHDTALVERHPAWGSELLADIPGVQPVAAIVRFHQERWDGSGYPHGLAGERIPLASRAVGACAAGAAMVTGAAHAPAQPVADAIAELRRHAGRQFDPRVVDAVAEVGEARADCGAPA